MKQKLFYVVTVVAVITVGSIGCKSADDRTTQEKSAVVEQVEILPQDNTGETAKTAVDVESGEYYLNEAGILVDKVEKFKTQSFGEYSLTYPILEEGVDEVAVYEFDTNENIHVVLDATNIYQQISLDTPGDYGAVELEVVAQVEGIKYMFDGERYYIEDEINNLLTISDLMK